jgi:hypothetical protein
LSIYAVSQELKDGLDPTQRVVSTNKCTGGKFLYNLQAKTTDSITLQPHATYLFWDLAICCRSSYSSLRLHHLSQSFAWDFWCIPWLHLIIYKLSEYGTSECCRPLSQYGPNQALEHKWQQQEITPCYDEDPVLIFKVVLHPTKSISAHL